jgi:hypothetical protein
LAEYVAAAPGIASVTGVGTKVGNPSASATGIKAKFLATTIGTTINFLHRFFLNIGDGDFVQVELFAHFFCLHDFLLYCFSVLV